MAREEQMLGAGRYDIELRRVVNGPRFYLDRSQSANSPLRIGGRKTQEQYSHSVVQKTERAPRAYNLASTIALSCRKCIGCSLGSFSSCWQKPRKPGSQESHPHHPVSEIRGK